MRRPLAASPRRSRRSSATLLSSGAGAAAGAGQAAADEFAGCAHAHSLCLKSAAAGTAASGEAGAATSAGTVATSAGAVTVRVSPAAPAAPAVTVRIRPAVPAVATSAGAVPTSAGGAGGSIGGQMASVARSSYAQSADQRARGVVLGPLRCSVRSVKRSTSPGCSGGTTPASRAGSGGRCCAARKLPLRPCRTKPSACDACPVRCRVSAEGLAPGRGPLGGSGREWER
eukprot:scaffold93646_cov60-Phaeocystis_antarctica.AAC.3